MTIISMRLRCWACQIFLAVPLAALGQITSTNITAGNLNLAIPDGNLGGMANSVTISGMSGPISSIEVGLDIAGTGDGAFNGDLYATLVSDSGGFAVLLNRPGRTSANHFGYSDNGLDVTFDDSASDIHLYQSSASFNAFGQLTGTWAPDGRNISPLSVLDTTPRTALLSDFDGLSANGGWTLFVTDASNGATAELLAWSLTIETVPEPSTSALFAVGIAGLSLALRSRPRRPFGP